MLYVKFYSITLHRTLSREKVILHYWKTLVSYSFQIRYKKTIHLFLYYTKFLGIRYFNFKQVKIFATIFNGISKIIWKFMKRCYYCECRTESSLRKTSDKFSCINCTHSIRLFLWERDCIIMWKFSNKFPRKGVVKQKFESNQYWM